MTREDLPDLGGMGIRLPWTTANDVELPLAGVKGAAIIKAGWRMSPGVEDWLDVALEALEHAGCSLKEQKAIWTIVGRGERR